MSDSKSKEKSTPTFAEDLNDIEIKGLLEAMYERYGYDFREYSKAHVKRRVLNRLRLSGIESISILQHKVLRDEALASLLIKDLSISVTEMFRDPEFYLAFRKEVIPILKTWSYIKIWHAGCSTGEEVYSMAILLKEEGLYERSQIYATDFNHKSLGTAEEGIFPAEEMKKYAQNYQNSGGINSFSEYFHAKYNSAIIDPSLKENIVWANHNLVTDADFAETHVIICRNVLIYFNKDLQNRVHQIFNSSLVKGGILCLGSKESLRFTEYSQYYEAQNKKQRIFKKRYQ